MVENSQVVSSQIHDAKEAMAKGNFEMADSALMSAEQIHLRNSFSEQAHILSEIIETRGTATLLDGNIKEAYLHFVRAGKCYEVFDPFEAALSLNKYAMQIYSYCLGRQKKGLQFVRSLLLQAIGNISPQTPGLWADVHHNLETALCSYGENCGDTDAESLFSDSINAFLVALSIGPDIRTPEEWASSKSYLAVSYIRRSERADLKAAFKDLEKAAKALEASLTIYQCDTTPQEWARVQNNLGIAYLEMGKRLQDHYRTEYLSRSARAYRASLQVRQRHIAPYEWAKVQNNLGTTYRELGRFQTGEEKLSSLDKVLNALANALEVFHKDTLPLYWAMAMYNKGVTQILLASVKTGDEANQYHAQAQSSLTSAQEIFDPLETPAQWEAVQKEIHAIIEMKLLK